MKQMLCAALMATGLSACVAAPSTDGEIAQASASAASEPASGFDEWGTGKELYMYHRVQGTCQALTHAHGRNAAWGLWKLPLAEVTDGGAEENEEGGAFVRLTCIDGTACIGKGALEVTPELLGLGVATQGAVAVGQHRMVPHRLIERPRKFELGCRLAPLTDCVPRQAGDFMCHGDAW